MMSLMRHSLEQDYGFPQDNIVELSENATAKGRPTHDNILRS